MNIVIACGKTQPQGRVGVLRRRGPTAALSSIKELRRFRLKRRQVASCALKPSTHIGAIVALACVLFGDASANVAVSKILNDMSYHDSEDLVDAGARMLRDAVAHGLDINEIEMDGPATSLGDTANGRLRFGIGINVVELNMRGRSYPERLRQEKAVADTSLHVAILVANRGLSIGEMSELLRARVRILAFGDRNVFVLRASVATLERVSRMSYCARLEEFAAEMKHEPTWSASPFGYDIRYFGSDREHAMRLQDIADLDLEYTGGYPPMRGLAVRGPWERVQRLQELWWVRFIAPYVPPRIEDIAPVRRSGMLDEHLQDPDKALRTNMAANDSRNLVAAQTGANSGAGAIVAIKDRTFGWGHDSVSGRVNQNSTLSTGTGSSHGIQVASIAVGNQDLCALEPIRGIAPAASALFRPSDEAWQTTFGILNSSQVKVLNNSWVHNDPISHINDLVSESIDTYSYVGGALAVCATAGPGQTGAYLATPMNAKNVLTVGGIKYVNLNLGTAFADSAGSLSPSAQRGPTLDGRLKPELVAPCGVHDSNGVPEHGVVAASLELLPSYCVDGVSGSYDAFVGTSYSAPFVAGVAARLLERSPSDSPLMLKAILINTAIPLKGNKTWGRDPVAAGQAGFANCTFGYGLVNAGIVGDESISRLIKVEQTIGRGASTPSHLFILPDDAHGRRPVRMVATLVYHDYPNAPGAFSLRDDLDLSLKPFGGAEVTALLPDGATAEGPIDKIIIEDLVNGLPQDWTWRVNFANSGASLEATFALVVDVHYATPSLSVAVVGGLPVTMYPGQRKSVTVRVRSAGSTIAGASVGVDDTAWPLTFDAGTATLSQPKFLGNLYDPSTGQHEATYALYVTAPVQQGQYGFLLRADAINREFSENPVDLWVPVNVSTNSSKVRGVWACGDSYIRGSAHDASGHLYVVGESYPVSSPGTYRVGVQKLSSTGTSLFAPWNSYHWKTLQNAGLKNVQYSFWSPRTGLVVVAQDLANTLWRVNVAADGTEAAQFLAGSELGFSRRYAHDERGGLYITRKGADGRLSIEWQDCAPAASPGWHQELGIVVSEEELLRDGAGGVFVVWRGSISGGATGTYIWHFEASGSTWPAAQRISSGQVDVVSATIAPGGGAFVQLSDGFMHRVAIDGALLWGPGGKPCGADLRIVGDDCAGGLYLSDRPPSASPTIMRYDGDLTPLWDHAVPLDVCTDRESGRSYGDLEFVGNGRGGLFVACETRLSGGVGTDFTFLQEFDASGGAQWDTCHIEDEYTHQPGKFVGPDGRGGAVYWQRLEEMSPSGWEYHDKILILAEDIVETCTIRGRIFDSEGRPAMSVAIIARDIVTGSELGRAITEIGGAYTIEGIPAYRGVRLETDAGAPTLPTAYHWAAMESDVYCDFRLSAPPGNWTNSDQTAGPILGQYKVTNSAVFTDFDDDGDLDLYIGYGEAHPTYVYTTRNGLFLNGGGGSFTEMNPPGPADGYGWNGSTMSVAPADMDNDGDVDLYLCNGDAFFPTDPNVLLENISGTSGEPFATVHPFLYPAEIRDSNLGGKAEWIDMNNDGLLDLFVGRPDRTCLVFRGGAPPEFSRLQTVAVPGLTDLVSNGSSSWADFDNDGLVDVLVFATQGNRLLRNNGDWTFTDVTYMLGGTGAIEGFSKSAAWGDYDNDGDVDLFLNYHWGTPKRLFRNDGVSFADVTAEVGLPVDGSESSAAAWFDFDNDGDLDLIVTGAPTVIWENHNTGAEFTRSASTDIVNHVIPNTLALGDVDGDGDEDVYLGVTQLYASESYAHSKLYENRYGDHGASIGVGLDGTTCNRDGIGAVVRVHTAGGNIQTRQLTGMTGGSSPQVKDQVIGIGHNEVAARVEVRWPWGRLTEVPLVPAGTTIVVTDEFAAPQAGAIYLTTSSSGARTQPIGDYELGEYVDFYLAADFSGVAVEDQLLGGYEIEVKRSSVLYDMTIEPLIAGVDSDPDPWKFSVRFSDGVALNQGPISLAHFRGQLFREGADASIGLGARVPCSFTDPLEPASACWWGGDSGVLYRFEETFVDNGITYHIPDTKAPLIAWAGLYPWNPAEPRSWVAVAFDEPLSDSCFLPEFYLNFSRIFNPTNPSITKSVSEVWPMGEKTYWLHLTTPIQAGKLFDLEAMGVSDRVGNVRDSTIHNVCNEENPDVDFNELFFAVAKNEGGGASVEWVELYNAEDAPVCINGWSVSNGTGGVLHAPYEPLCILPPGGHVVLAAAGTDTTLFDEDIVLVCASSRLELSNSTLALLSPFGVQADEFDAGAAKARAAGSSCSVQRFTNQHTKSTSWEFDGPDFAPGRRGTPGFDNQRADGTGNGVDLPAIGRTGLLYAAPNPFNPATDIYLALRAPGRVTIKIYDIMGRVVRTLMDEERHESALLHVTWNGLNEAGLRCASGVYLVKMDAQDCDPRSLKITLLK